MVGFLLYMANNTFYPNDLMNQLLGFGSLSNKSKSLQWLINNGYGGNTITYSIINKIVSTSIDVPLVVHDSNGEIVEQGKVFDALNMPAIYRGELLNTKEWIEYAMTYLLTSGNLFQRKTDLIGVESNLLEIIPSSLVTPKMPNSYLDKPIGYTITDKGTKALPLVDVDDMSHVKYVNPTSMGLTNGLGLSPLQAGILSLMGNSDIQEALTVMVGNQGVRGILSPKATVGGMPSIVDNVKGFAEKLRKTITGVDKVNSVHITNTPVDYTAMGMNVADLKLLESIKITDRQLCNIYSVDSKLFNDPEASTFNNLPSATKGLYENAIFPTLNKVVGSFNDSVAKSLDSSQKVVIDTSKIPALQPDKKEEADKNKANAKAIAEILNSNTDTSGKVNSLVYVIGMTEEQAINIVGNGTEGTED